MTTIYYNGVIYTQNPKQPRASAMMVTDNLFTAAGSDDEVLAQKTSGTELIDLGGKTVLPGFNDAHIHIWKVGQLESFIIDLRGVRSIGQLQAQVKTAADRLPEGTWIMGRGFNEQTLAEKRMPHRQDLDEVTTDHPVYLIRTCAHIAAANSVALKLAGITSATIAPEGGVIGKQSNGEPDGLFYETALGLITRHIPAPSRKEYQEMISLGVKKLLQFGVTSATDPAVHPELLEGYKTLPAEDARKMRMNLMPILLPDGGDKPFPVPAKYEDDFLRVTTVKFFSDGGLSGKTAALRHPYKNSTEHGVLRLQRAGYLELARDAQRKGFRIATHAIGDEAIDLVIDVYKALHAEFGPTRNRLEHFGLPSRANIDDVATYGFVPVPQPIFLDELGENFISALPDDYLSFCYPVRSLLDKGIPVAFSTDAPVVKNINPWRGIRTAITRKTAGGNTISPGERVSIEEAIYAYTMGSAYAEGTENMKGSIERGKVADFMVLDKDPYTLHPEDLETIQTESTFVAGECKYSPQRYI